MTDEMPQREGSLRQSPMVLTGVMLLVGVVIGWGCPVPVRMVMGVAVGGWILWMVSEWAQWGRVASVYLAMAMVGAGGALWELNQGYGEAGHLARFCAEEGEVPVAVRARVVVAPEGSGAHVGNLYWVCEGTEILTGEGWVRAAGLAQVKWRAGGEKLKRGEVVEMYGWMRGTEGAKNPGGMDERHRLGADRIFVVVRVPRVSGVRVIGTGGVESGGNWLGRMRALLRAKLLEHTARVDVDAARTMVALVLGYRDPGMAEISQAFADAGVAHLLAISGAHVVFIAWLVWAILRWVPMRPRWREAVVAGVVLAYVVATPCGPPVVRAVVVVGMVLVTRLLGRPRQYLNMLAAGMVAVVIWRPADVLDAGFELTFICTAGLVVLPERVRLGMFGAWLERQELIAGLADTRWRRVWVWGQKHVALILTANIVGALTSIPLVMVHFNQMNLYGVVTGILAFPLVAVTMVAGILQLAAEGVSSGLAAGVAPVTTAIAHGMVWWVEWLAAIPGAAVGVRSPPAWVVAIMYVPVVLWVVRRRARVSRAMVVNVALGSLVVMVGWYVMTARVGAVELQVLSVGQGSAVVMRTPSGGMWMVDAGSRDQARVGETVIGPALRVAGERRVEGMVLAKVDAVHASAAGEVVGRYRPTLVFVPSGDGGWTLAREELTEAAKRVRVDVKDLAAGDRVALGGAAVAQVLWPAGAREKDPAMAVMVEYASRRVLLVDSSSVLAMTLLPLNGVDLRCDAVVVLGPERGAADDLFRKRVAELGASVVVWSGRTPWAPHAEVGNVVNAAEGCVTVRVEGDGELTWSGRR